MNVLVIGAGLSGLSAALHLRGQGHHVTVLERAAVPGGRSGRIERDLFSDEGAARWLYDGRGGYVGRDGATRTAHQLLAELATASRQPGPKSDVPRSVLLKECVRNHQARNFMRDDMRVGDLAFFYHSSCAEPGISRVITLLLSNSAHRLLEVVLPKDTLLVNDQVDTVRACGEQVVLKWCRSEIGVDNVTGLVVCFRDPFGKLHGVGDCS